VLVLLACYGPGTSETPEFGEGHTGETADTGPVIVQADECKAYLRCASAVDPNAYDQQVAAYGGEGSCWEDKASAAACKIQCEDALERLRGEHPEEEACEE
jgi:hypothetical protein